MNSEGDKDGLREGADVGLNDKDGIKEGNLLGVCVGCDEIFRVGDSETKDGLLVVGGGDTGENVGGPGVGSGVGFGVG